MPGSGSARRLKAAATRSVWINSNNRPKRPDPQEFLLDGRLARTDPEIFAVIERERQRQLNKLEMIASENFVSGDGAAGPGFHFDP